MVTEFLKSTTVVDIVQNQNWNCSTSPASFGHLLRGFANVGDLQSGILLHDHLVAKGLGSETYLCNQLIYMYVKCGSLDRARQVFNTLSDPGPLSWLCMISAHVKAGELERALLIFRRMQLQGILPDRKTLVAAIGACYKPSMGIWIHSLVQESGYDCVCAVVGTALIKMYLRCGSLKRALHVFKRLKHRDVFAWTAMIAAFAEYRHTSKAMLTYKEMLLDGFLPTPITFVLVLEALTEEANKWEACKIHTQITQRGFESDPLVVAALIRLFSSCGDPKKARRVFRRSKTRDLATYKALLRAHIENGEFWNAVQLFIHSRRDGVAPDKEIVLTALACCVEPEDLEHGKEIHIIAINSELESDGEVANSLLNMYKRCGGAEDAEWMFERIVNRDLLSWTSLIQAFADDPGDWCAQALSLFRKMQLEGFSPGENGFAGVLRACGRLTLVKEGRVIEELMIQAGLESKAGNKMRNELVSFYIRCGSWEDAWRVFDRVEQPNVQSWNGLMEIEGNSGPHLFRMMLLEGVPGNSTSFCLALAACRSLDDVKTIHCCITERGYDSMLTLKLGNSLLAAYKRFGSSNLEVINGMRRRDESTWKLVLAMAEERIKVNRFKEMLLDGFKPSQSSICLLMNSLTAEIHLRDVKFIHSCVSESGDDFLLDAAVMSSLMRLYSRCGSLKNSCEIFNKTHPLGVAVWNAMMSCFSSSGYPENGFQLFQRMDREGIQPSKTSFVEVLRACAMSEALDQGKLVHLEAAELGVELDVGVGSALVSFYGKCGRVYPAEDVFFRMQQRSLETWSCMISGYLINGFTEDALELLRVMQLEGLARKIDHQILCQFDINM